MLHIINKSPLANCALDSCLRVVQAGDILLIEDAVYAATSGNAFEGRIREAMERLKIYVLQPDIDARGFTGRIIEVVTPVDYSGFVELTTTNKTCQSWL